MTMFGITASTNIRVYRVVTAVVVAAIALGGSHALADEPQVRLAVSGEFSLPLMEAMAKAFSESQGTKNDVDIQSCDAEGVGRVLRDECDVLAIVVVGDAGVPKPLKSAEMYRVGQSRLAVLVHPDNPIKSLKMDDLRTILRDKSSTWRKVTGAGTTNAIEVVSAIGERSPHNGIVRRCMTFAEKVPGGYRRGYYLFRDDMKTLYSPQDAIAQVGRNGKAIGILPLTGIEDVRRVKVLPIGEGEDSTPVSPELGPLMQEKYPLSEDVILFLNPKASPLARRFCEFVTGEAGAQVAAQHGIISTWQERQYIGDQRLKEMKASKGVRLSAIGIDDGSKTVSDLAIEYVKAKATIQLGYAATDSDTAAIGMFVRVVADATTLPADSAATEDASDSSGSATMPASAPAASSRITPFVKADGKELLLLGDKPSTRAMELHGEKWNSLGVDKDGKPDGTGPKEHILAGRAVAIIVNPANKLDSLTLPQLQAIFGGEVKEWSIIGGAGLEPGERVGGKTLPINLHGLRANDVATAVFEAECLPRDKWVGVTRQADTAEAVKAVSMDPNAMAFVDLSAIPGLSLKSLTDGFSAGGQNVKVLAIQVGVGERAEVVKPSPANIANAMYPLAQRVYLYVHPDASDSAKGFAEFIATCGGSEATPYADTVKAVMDTYQKHGLIPLADAAIERMTKDAMAAAKSQAAKGDEGKDK